MADQPDSYGRVIDDGQRTVTLAGTVVDLVGRPISSILRRRSAVQALRERLGEWAKEAVDASGHWLQPVLRTTAFENHLVKENGYFKPSGSCESTFGWAHLLYALDIRPGRGVLAWRVPTDGADAAESGQISLDIDGQTFCHIINLYREYTGSHPKDLSEGSQKMFCRLPFGTLSILREENSKFKVSFQSGTPEELAAPRIPFSYCVWFFTGDRLKFEKEFVVAKYYNAIHYGVSDTRALLPDPTCSLIERTQGLVRSIHLLFLNGNSDPYLLTDSWLEEASRIKRRVSTNGGEDQSLILTITTALSKMPDVVKQLEAAMCENDNWEHWVRSALQEKCMFTRGQFSLIWSARRISTSRTAIAVGHIVRQQLPIVLAQFASTPPGTWRHTLSEMVEDVATLLNTSDRRVNDPGIVLELTPESEMWRADFHICG